jgi:hypothetical protein
VTSVETDEISIIDEENSTVIGEKLKAIFPRSFNPKDRVIIDAEELCARGHAG